VTLPGGSFIVDEPETMPGGQNKGPNPIDLFCGSFGTCQEITYKMYATVLGIKLKSVSANVETTVDLRGLVGLAEKKGLTTLTCTLTLETDATEEKIAELKAAVDAHCPLVATLNSSVPVSTSLTTVNTNAAGVEAKLKEDPVQAEGLMAVINAGKEDENALKTPFGCVSKLESEGLDTKMEFTSGQSIVVDEPETMPGGNNKGPNPLDVFCASFGTCQEITYKMYGTVMGIPVNAVSCKVSAPCDLRGLVGLGGPVGITEVRGEIELDTPASEEQVATLKAAVDANCPLFETIREPIEVVTKTLITKTA